MGAYSNFSLESSRTAGQKSPHLPVGDERVGGAEEAQIVMINGGPSGFHNAPVTKAFVVATAIFSTALGIRGISSTLLGFSHELIFRKFHSWVLLSSLFAFSSTPELLFGVSLLYYFRVFERQIGSNKHSVFICFTVIVSLVLNVLSLALLKDLVFMPGPYGLIYSSFVPFFFDIPISSRIRIFRIPLSDKSFVYLAGLQLLFSSWKRSLLPGLSGVLAGSLYHFNFLGIRSAKFPETIASFFRRLSRPSLGGLGHTSTSRNFPGSAISNMVHEDVSIPVTAPLMQPPQDSITSLVSMGFDTDSARQALLLAGNDVNLATNILLETR